MSGRSVGERMQRAGSQAVRLEIAEDWAAAWKRDHDEVLAKARRAIASGRPDAAELFLGQLAMVDERAMSALPSILKRLGG